MLSAAPWLNATGNSWKYVAKPGPKGFKQDPKEKKPPSIEDLPEDLVDYIKRTFPNMDDETIMKNADIFKDGRACGMRMGNKRCRFRYDASTKQVDLVVIA